MFSYRKWEINFLSNKNKQVCCLSWSTEWILLNFICGLCRWETYTRNPILISSEVLCLEECKVWEGPILIVGFSDYFGFGLFLTSAKQLLKLFFEIRKPVHTPWNVADLRICLIERVFVTSGDGVVPISRDQNTLLIEKTELEVCVDLLFGVPRKEQRRNRA